MIKPKKKKAISYGKEFLKRGIILALNNDNKEQQTEYKLITKSEKNQTEFCCC